MGYLIGRNTGWTSHEVKRIFQELKRGNKDYHKNARLCPSSRCKSGFWRTPDGKNKKCPVCDGYGIVRKI